MLSVVETLESTRPFGFYFCSVCCGLVIIVAREIKVDLLPFGHTIVLSQSSLLTFYQKRDVIDEEFFLLEAVSLDQNEGVFKSCTAV